LEETEHKAVAFDVYNQVIGEGVKSYLLRTGTFTFANAIFWPAVTAVYLDLLRRDKQLTDLKGWRATYQNLWGKNGVLKLIVPDWFDYFKPGFHPWDHDNRHLLKRVEEIVKVVDAHKSKTQIPETQRQKNKVKG
ncbi:MAG: metal-dependent hydrolase, partial [Pseudomonadales bacterium]|nr:metal-dependent hydrolase [Pseudomonadales bacterium]